VTVTTLKRKLDYLASCLNEGADEDAAGHLCDLLEYCRLRIVSDEGMTFADLASMVAYYGKKPQKVTRAKP
jgi:hypothetical protein